MGSNKVSVWLLCSGRSSHFKVFSQMSHYICIYMFMYNRWVKLQHWEKGNADEPRWWWNGQSYPLYLNLGLSSFDFLVLDSLTVIFWILLAENNFVVGNLDGCNHFCFDRYCHCIGMASSTMFREWSSSIVHPKF